MARREEEAMILIPKYMLAIVPIIAMLIGIGASWGLALATYENNSKRIDVMEGKIDLMVEVKTDISWIKKEIEKMRQAGD